MKVQALKGFDTFRVGDVATVTMDVQLAHLIVCNYLRLLEDPLWRVHEFIEPRSEPRV